MPRLREFKWQEWADKAHEIANGAIPVIAVDTETSGVGYYDEAFCATLSVRDGLGRLQSFYVSLEGDGLEHRTEQLREILAAVPIWIMHNAKFDLAKLALAGALPADWEANHLIEDTATLYALLDENDRKGLKYLAGKLLGETTNEDKVMAKVRRKLKLKKSDGYQHIPREHLVPYAIKDTEFTLRLYELLRPKLPAELEELYAQEIELTKALLDIEANGIALDMPYLEAMTSAYGARVMKGWRKIVKLTGIEDPKFPNSPVQLKAAFEARGYNLESTAKAELAKLDDELARELLQYRSDSKLHKTYLVALMNEQRDGLVHPSFNTTLPRTGRMSSSAASNN